jgi:hypothetical protein
MPNGEDSEILSVQTERARVIVILTTDLTNGVLVWEITFPIIILSFL